MRNIIEAYEFEENYKEELKPEFRSTETSFFAVLKNLNYVGQSVGQSEGKNAGQKINAGERRNKILEIIDQKAKITALELSRIFSVSERTIERDLARLTEAGLVEYVGSSKDGEWRVKSK